MAKSDHTSNGAVGQADHSSSIPDLPQIAAAFVVKFDNQKGYTLAWHKAIEGLELEGVVEFKTLPSGLHNVKEDLVYFIHDDFAGVSAFLNRQDDEAARNARMLAVGVMVPVESGRMGKGWLHAEGLQELARKQVETQDDYTSIEEYWSEHRIPSDSQENEAAGSSSKHKSSISGKKPQHSIGYHLSQSMRVGTLPLGTNHILPAHHPALALDDLLRTFGPLMFPLLRAALLRKRILLLGEAPVERSCDYVYNLSILSSLPRDIASYLPLNDTADLRLRPLFNVGISDIPSLLADKSGQGWIACTTDDVLCTKPDLFDLLVILPHTDLTRPLSRRYPKLIVSTPELAKAYPKLGLRASQRDARRFATLWKGLKIIPASTSAATDQSAVEDTDESNVDTENDDPDSKSIISTASSTFSRTSIVEPQSWSRIAYTSLVWWASAGDKRTGLTEAEDNELDQDATLLDVQDPNDVQDFGEEEQKTREVAVVAYFHRLSDLIFGTLAGAIHRTDGDQSDAYRDNPDESEEQPSNNETQPTDGGADNSNDDNQPLLPNRSRTSDDSGPPVDITQEDVTSMGLDVWSVSDRKFVEEMVSFWWGREATLQGGRVECCGIRIL